MKIFVKINELLVSQKETKNKEIAELLATQKYLRIFESVIASFSVDKAILKEDFSQDCLLHILEKGLTIREPFLSDAQLCAFLRKMAYRRCLNLVKKSQRQVTQQLEPEQNQLLISEEKESSFLNTSDVFHRTLQRLSILTSKEKEVFMHRLEGLTPKQISNRMKISETDANSTFSRARRKIRPIWREEQTKDDRELKS